MIVTFPASLFASIAICPSVRVPVNSYVPLFFIFTTLVICIFAFIAFSLVPPFDIPLLKYILFVSTVEIASLFTKIPSSDKIICWTLSSCICLTGACSAYVKYKLNANIIIIKSAIIPFLSFIWFSPFSF